MKMLILMVPVLSILLYSSSNPVKMSIMILMMALGMFLTVHIMIGSSWIPMILTMLFTGGVLIMFMILSTFHPNEATSKIKNWKMILIWSSMAGIYMPMMNSDLSMMTTKNLKTFYQDSQNMVFLTLIITLYFVSFMKIILKEKSAMRMSFC